MPCIYIFTSPKGKSYIGQALDFEKRKARHKWESLVNNSQVPFHRAIRMYGLENFQQEIIHCDINEMNLFEKFLIQVFKGIGKVYNLTDGGEDSKGIKRSLETKEKIRQWNLNRPKEFNVRVSETQKGRVFTEEHKNKIRIARAFQIFSEESKEKRRQSLLAAWKRRKDASTKI